MLVIKVRYRVGDTWDVSGRCTAGEDCLCVFRELADLRSARFGTGDVLNTAFLDSFNDRRCTAHLMTRCMPCGEEDWFSNFDVLTHRYGMFWTHVV